MRYIFRRLGVPLSPGWAFGILFIGLIVGAAFWVGPLRPLPPELQLLALQPNGAFTDSIAVPSREVGGSTRFPLVLGARNVGYNPARPTVLELSVPLGFRLVDRDGRAYPRESMPGSPLAHYALGLTAPTMRPGAVPELLLDTVWLEPDLDDYTCTVLSDGVPEFTPAPPANTPLLRRVDIFYSFRTPDTQSRQAGLLQVRVDSTALQQPTAFMGEPGTPIVVEPESELPPMGTLYQVSTTDALCGDPQQPVELRSVVYANEAGGRFIVVYHNEAPRKYLIDMNGDSVIEQEVWDPDADGAFEATRSARYAIPAFLFPRAPDLALLAGDTVPPDSAFLALYADTLRGPFRFSAALHPQPAGAGVAAPVAAATPTLPAGAPIPGDTMPVDPEWLVLYSDTVAGPFRFARGLQPTRDSAAEAVAARDSATGPDTAAAAVDADAEPGPAPATPRRTGPRILGTPVEYPPGTRPPV